VNIIIIFLELIYRKFPYFKHCIIRRCLLLDDDGEKRQNEAEVKAGWKGCAIDIVPFDWGGEMACFVGKNGKHYVDPKYIELFKKEHGAV